jgi:Zn-dependent metalloprotease
MKKVLSLLSLLLFVAATLSAQRSKPALPKTSEQTPFTPQINWPGKAVPPAINPFYATAPRLKPAGPLQTLAASRPEAVSVKRAENGLPIFFEGKTSASGSSAESLPMNQRALEYCASLQPQGIDQPAQEFTAKSVHTDEQGNAHVRLEQTFHGLPVWGAELVCHTHNGAFTRMNGRYFPTPSLTSITPAINSTEAIWKVKMAIGLENLKTDWTEQDLKMIDGEPFSASLVVFHVKDELNGERLAWHVAARPNVFSRSEWFIDAATGEVLNAFEHTCNLLGHYHAKAHNTSSPVHTPHEHATTLVDGPVNISGVDLLDVTRNLPLAGWQFGSQVALEDASKSMFNAAASTMPGDPVGAIVTLDAFNTSPENQNFNVDLIVSNNTTFTNKKAAISAHYNAIKSFDYFKTKFNRNSIDGVGGNVISIVNVTEADASSMENAFWNGAAMFYGNGGSVFKPLARGLDVGGHEMTHGVIEKTANLIYQNESGALNESFADIFGQMIDGDVNDWKIGEDVMQSGGGLPSALRDMQNPNNGQPAGSGFWQPDHTDDQYMGPADNGGVHINSGIINRAYYVFASNAAVGTTKAEQVFYKALRDYLVKSSKFVDCRLAVIQASNDLYGSSVADVAANAFASVGIGGSAPSGNYLGTLSPNPGTDFILCTSNSGDLEIATGAGQVVTSLYTEGIISRPSITDNGVSMVFVNEAGHLIAIEFDWSLNQYTVTDVDQGPWRNAAISKDGRFLALLKDFLEPRIYIFDLADPFGGFETFFLYNPTYTQGQITGDVDYADVLEFDYSNTYLMYDAYNTLDNIGYWDIGFVQFWENGQFADGGDAFITKLFTGLPEKVSINNPTLAKNSPYILAFDLIDETSNVRFDIYGANAETGDYDVILTNNGDLSYPNYNRLDTRIIFDKPTAQGYDIRSQGLNATKIQPQGGNTSLIPAHYWGVWFANGIRSLQVGTEDLQSQGFAMVIAPNPTADVAQLRMNAPASTNASISIHSILGETLITRNVTLAQGENLLDLDLQSYPAGHYVVRIVAENGSGAALKVVKQ